MKMNFHRAAILGLLLIVGCLYFTAESRPQAGQASDPGVAKVTRILEELRENDEQGTVANKTYQVTEEELNAYLSAKLHQQHQKAVESIALLLKEGTFLTRVEVNVDEIEFPVDDVTTGYLRLLLKGIQTLEIEGTLEAENGMATYRVQEARLSGIPIPARLVNNILSSLGKKNDPPFDPSQPFEMPHGIQSFTFQPGTVIMRTGDKRPLTL